MARRHLVPITALKDSSGGSLIDSTPLLEEEGDVSGYTLIAQFCDPRFIHWAGLWAGLAAHNHPIYVSQIELAKWTDQWFTGEEFYGCWSAS